MGTSYVRQSSMADGDTITAALFNDEFNRLLTAFSYASSSTTGHQHDGTAAEGGNIHTIGDQDFLNKIVADSTNNRWGFFVEVSSSAVEQIRIQDGAIVPVTDNDIDLGTSSLEFKDAYFDGTVTTDALVADTADINGGSVDGATLGTNSAITQAVIDNVNINGTTIGHTDDTDLITLADGVVTIAGELDATTLDISGNADIDGTLEADAYTVDGTALNEYIADTVGAMVGSNTETNITVTYEDGDNTLDFVIGTLNQDTTGTADNFTVSANNSTDETVYPIFVDGATGSQGAESDTGLTYNPSSGLLTISGELDAGSLDISGNADIDGTLEADAITVDGTALNEYIADTVGAMVGSNTESGITVAYQDGDNTLDFTVGTLNQDTTGTAAVATTVTITDNESTNENNAIIFTAGGDLDGGNLGLESDGDLTYNPSTGLLSSTGVTASGTVTFGTLSDGTIGVTAWVDEDNMSSDSATLVPTQQSVKAYVDSQTSGSGTMSNFILEDDDGTEVTVSNAKEVKFIGSGITTNWTDTDNGTDGDPYDLTFTVDAAQTGITSIYATDLIMGEDSQTAIDFGTANEIDFKVDNAARLTLTASALYPVTDNQIDLGTASLEFKDAFFDGTVTADAFAGPLTGNVTGNASGTALTVTQAAQSAITSLGTLTTLTVDNVIINGTTIGHTSDTDLMTLADGIVTVAGEVSLTTLDIGGTNVTSTAAELNILDGVTATATELNYLDLATLGTSAASKVVSSDANNVVRFTGGIHEEATTVTSSSNATTINLRTGTNFLHDLTEATTFTFSNPPAEAMTFALKIIQDSTARAITWPGAVDWAAATAPTLTSTNNGVDYFVFTTIDGGTIWYGFTAGQALG
jgi:cytoskeletal protein CcmA (bactofilin family)